MASRQASHMSQSAGFPWRHLRVWHGRLLPSLACAPSRGGENQSDSAESHPEVPDLVISIAHYYLHGLSKSLLPVSHSVFPFVSWGLRQDSENKVLSWYRGRCYFWRWGATSLLVWLWDILKIIQSVFVLLMTWCYGVNHVLPKFIHRSPHPLCFRMWPYLEIESIKRWLSKNEAVGGTLIEYDWYPHKKEIRT